MIFNRYIKADRGFVQIKINENEWLGTLCHSNCKEFMKKTLKMNGEGAV